MLRRLRALLLTATLWAVVWALAGALVALLHWGLFPLEGFERLRALPNYLGTYGIDLGIAGFLCGAGFGALLVGAERNRTIAELSHHRIATWGGIAGAVMPVGFLVLLKLAFDVGLPPVIPMEVVTFCSGVMGAAAAAGSLAAARRTGIPPVEEIRQIHARTR